MTLNLHIDAVHIHYTDKEQLSSIFDQLKTIIQKLNSMSQELDNLKAAVAQDTQVEQSAITLLNGLKTQFDAAIAANDPAALQALSDQLGQNTTALAAAVAANTPAAAPQG